MLRDLFGLGKGMDFMGEILIDFKGMLSDTQTMFISAYGGLFQAVEDPRLRQREIYDIDQRVNAMQKQIRKRVAEHMSLQPTVDTVACLIMMSVVKDAERLGDFAKNLYEIRELVGGAIDRDTFKSYFNGVSDDIQELYARTGNAFMESDEQVATTTWEFQRQIKSRCNDVIVRVTKSNLKVDEAVAFALMARYFIRISSHLTNIATSIIVPLDNLDYFVGDKDQD